MRDSLIKILKQTDFDYCEECVVASEDGYKCAPDFSEFFADRLLENGVIVPPCKVGDITYIFDYEVNNNLETKFRGIVPYSVEEITIDSEGVWVDNGYAKYNETAFGDIIFLTREDAENALAKMKGGAE